MKKNIIFQILLGVSLTIMSCSGPKKAVTPLADLPSWVKQPPIADFYYVGLGSVEKTPYNVNDYRETAKKSALSEISSAISVAVKSNSSLQSVDNQQGVQHHFQSNIITESAHNLEGVELVDSWENDNVYWAYYRLSKLKYQEQQLRDSKIALEKAKDAFAQGKIASESGDLNKAMQLWSTAMSSYLPYKEEISRLGLDTSLDQHIWGAIVKAVGKLRWQTPPSFTGVRGSLWDIEMRRFTLWNGEHGAVSSIPVELSLDGGSGLKAFEGATDQNGEVVASLAYVMSPRTEMSLTVKVDLKRWSRKLSADINIRKQISQLAPIVGNIRVKVVSPKIRVVSKGSSEYAKRFTNEWRSKIQQEHLCRLADKGSQYTMELKLNPITSKNGYGSYTVDFTGHVVIKDRSDRVVWQQNISRCSGVSMDQGESFNIAYKKLSQWINYRAYPQMMKGLHLK
ncbi:LPP20 family lipoprotein [Halosquirtibacter xylanolyticus]|uniref:LPP20 family lipoprotein n=1 Tax=Halosquirtibacter xylanolyticus TaxID=3374599 RepID=UPI0037480BFA|nr:LPP20 family lipoprotein [Prolixibacteraceae bacterium]